VVAVLSCRAIPGEGTAFADTSLGVAIFLCTFSDVGHFMFSLLLFVVLQSSARSDDLPNIAIFAPTSRTKTTSEGFPVLLRIPQTLIAKSVDREFQHTAPVQQEVLGTKSTGTSHCQGTVVCSIEEMADGAAFSCRISGTVQSETCGTNGPATIQSHACTSYVAHKRFFLDGHKFSSVPTSVVSRTQLTISGVGSTLPRLRGRIVRNVATQRAQQSLTQAEAITQVITDRELCQRIDAEFDLRISEMNQKLATRLSVLKYFPTAGNRIHIHSFTDGVEIGLGTEPLGRRSHVASRTPIGDSVELWLQPKTDLIVAGPFTELLFSTAPAWLSAYLSHNPALFEPHAKKISIQPHDGWLVLQLHE
ncbi:MAG TPA: hypothetical protein VM260_09240, partial [Pirellula sp.]|nr:hypothetical protein [Pirellula sp.]